jgi:integrase
MLPPHPRRTPSGPTRRQLGHANANITLSVYAHLFAQREHGEVARQALEASYVAMAEAREVGR